MTVRRCRVSSRDSADRASNSPCPWRGCAGKQTMTSETDDSAGYRRYLARGYLASLPERTARAGAAVTGGVVYEAGGGLLPLAGCPFRVFQGGGWRFLGITIVLVGG